MPGAGVRRRGASQEWNLRDLTARSGGQSWGAEGRSGKHQSQDRCPHLPPWCMSDMWAKSPVPNTRLSVVQSCPPFGFISCYFPLLCDSQSGGSPSTSLNSKLPPVPGPLLMPSPLPRTMVLSLSLSSHYLLQGSLPGPLLPRTNTNPPTIHS